MEWNTCFGTYQRYKPRYCGTRRRTHKVAGRHIRVGRRADDRCDICGHCATEPVRAQVEILGYACQAAELRGDRVTQAVRVQKEVRLHPRHAAELRGDTACDRILAQIHITRHFRHLPELRWQRPGKSIYSQLQLHYVRHIARRSARQSVPRRSLTWVARHPVGIGSPRVAAAASRALVLYVEERNKAVYDLKVSKAISETSVSGDSATFMASTTTNRYTKKRNTNLKEKETQ